MYRRVFTLLTSKDIIVAHIVGHVENVKQDKDLLPWGAWYVIRKDDIVLGDIGFKETNEEHTVEVGYI